MSNLDNLGSVGELAQAEPIALAKLLLRVRTREGKIQPLCANPAQLLFEARRGRQNIVLKARQMGITTWVAARFFLRTITQPGTLTLQVAHTQSAAEAIFRTVERMWRHLPEGLREGPLRRSRANAGQMVFPALDSEFRVGSACDPNVGRGMSVQNLHCSEVSRWEGDAAETLAGLRAALAPAGELVMESTPNGAYGAFYDEWSRATDACDGGGERYGAGETAGPVTAVPYSAQEDGVVRHFLPWWMEPAYVAAAVRAEEMTEEECALVVRHGLSREQIGFRRGLKSRYGALRSQEFAEDAESCFRATGACCFDVTAIERRLLAVPEPVERRRGGALQVWLPALAGSEYLVAVDTAGGGAEGDFAAVQVVERKTGLQCAELQERLRPSELAHVAAELAREYSGAVIAVERNNHGAAVLAYLETNEGYTRLYRQRGEAGFLTNAATKPEMIARLGSLLEHSPERWMSRRLLGECRTFVAGERGRTEAARGAHDDLVMAMAVAQAVRAEWLEGRMRA